ncbi:MAG: hypothetical protein JEY94_09760 [Melioribacteraceae bacterium]|nr:hypothetical protein [Melioribacteraceae bacterium]
MDLKLRSTLFLVIILIIIVTVGTVYIFAFQSGDIADREEQLKVLKQNEYDPVALQSQLDSLKKRATILDSVLALRKFNIPMNLKQSDFYNFVNKVSRRFDEISYVNIEYLDEQVTEHFEYYRYRLSGTATFNDIYELIYAVEQSKELKKIESVSMQNFITVDNDKVPHYLVQFDLVATVYSADNDSFASSEFVENKLIPNRLYDIFYPLIRNEIPPNTDNLLDVQTAQLLAIVPDGAFISDASGNTFLLWEGDEVYLGYLTQIDFTKSEVHFILNKGGIIEKTALLLDKQQEEKKQN